MYVKVCRRLCLAARSTHCQVEFAARVLPLACYTETMCVSLRQMIMLHIFSYQQSKTHAHAHAGTVCQHVNWPQCIVDIWLHTYVSTLELV